MKAFTLAIAAMTAFIATPVQAESWNMFSTHDGSAFLVDLDSIVDGEVWTAEVSMATQTEAEPMRMVHWVFDCRRRRTHIDSSVVMSEDGDIIRLNSETTETRPVRPGSIMDDIRIATCEGRVNPSNTFPDGIKLSEIREALRTGE